MSDVIATPDLAVKEKPCVYFTLEEAQLNEMKGLKVGSPVRVVVTGTVKGLGQREGYDTEAVSGNLDVEIDKISVSYDTKNEIAALFEDE